MSSQSTRMNDRDPVVAAMKDNPGRVRNWVNRPLPSRREMFGLAGSALTGMTLSGNLMANTTRIDKLNVPLINKAKNCIFILLTGAPSHVDTFDLKMTDGVSPAALLKPETINGILWPTGLLPKLGTSLNDFAIVRSMRSWALVHGLAQSWTQIGRNPTAALGDIAPNIGAIVAIEKQNERRSSDVLPTFLALNATGGTAGSGYLDSAYGPFKLTAINPNGLNNTTHREGQARFNDRMSLLGRMDEDLRANAPNGRPMADMTNFYSSGRALTYNPIVDNAFRLGAPDRARFGGNAFGDACLTSAQVLKAGAGTRYIQISFGSWDHHNNIYTDTVLPRMTRMLDDGLAALIAELKAAGLYEDTLIVMAGEFGRTVGRLSAANGRDHYIQQFCMLGGGGVKGGRTIGTTNANGSNSVEFGWSRQRDVRPEDIEATIYSALGINYTSIRYDDPFGRGFEYVPYAHDDLYAPVNELWA
jgi:hypothetical protein